MSNLKGVGWCIKPHTDAPWLQDCVDWPFKRHLLYEKYSWNEVFWQPKPPLSMALRGELSDFTSVLHILTWKINRFFAPRAKQKTLSFLHLHVKCTHDSTHGEATSILKGVWRQSMLDPLFQTKFSPVFHTEKKLL